MWSPRVKGVGINHQQIICLTTFKIFYAQKGKKRHLEEFVEKVANECNDQFTSAGPLIRDFTKDSAYHIANSTTFKYRIDSAANLGKDIVHAGLQLKMESPGVIKNRATAAAEAQNHLIMAKAAHNASSSQRRIRENSNEANLEVLRSAFENTKKYNHELPIFIDPCNPN
ncbi:hypothetical protein VP01_1912g1 [Puccinia sorghi]|uniref:Uncharacterized protein n=1 Tax=Puccinia sorghi TaxID=27349 RepID=A0A0L6VCM7_9BASI|nr:hypothetical protein VP01_1912g1 [Puccinia sorghi]